MYELRYIVRNGWDGPEKVLQYRSKTEHTHYDMTSVDGAGRLKTMEWNDWTDVPTVNETK